MNFFKKYSFTICIIALISLRFLHFENEIDDPHAWRQCETAQYIYSYATEGINILNPSVCWMGGHKTLLLEFPLPEAAIAVLYQFFGNHLWIARLFFLSFYFVSVIYFYKTLQLIYKNIVPEIATIIYCSLPLSLFYSRAIHIDFFALAFTHGMIYYYIKGVLEEKNKFWLLGTLMATIAFLTKVPYAFYMVLPIFYIALINKKTSYLIKHSYWTIIPTAAVLVWNYYSKSINTLAPDWDFIPNYNKFTNMWYWYFGSWHQRSLIELWIQISSRILNEVSGIIGVIIALWGILFYPKNKTYFFNIIWFAGTIIYLLIFYNLNVVHNYYQIPFLAPISIFIALGIYSIYLKLKQSLFTNIIMACIIGAVFIESYLYAEKNYYKVAYDQIDIAKVIEENSNPNDLVIVTYRGLTPQCPNILYRAKRYGWSIPAQDASAKLYYTLHKEANASKVVIIQPNELGGELFHFFNYFKIKKTIKLKKHNLNIYIADLVFEIPK